MVVCREKSSLAPYSLPYSLIRGRGPFHLTGRANYEAFARQVFGAGSTTYNQIMTAPGFMDTDFGMLALTAASYWSQRVTNANADALNEQNTVPPNVINIGTQQRPTWRYLGGSVYTDNISRPIATDAGSFIRRFEIWQRNAGLAYTGGNPYESMREALSRVGIKAVNATGYESQFGIALRVQKLLDIGGGTRALGLCNLFSVNWLKAVPSN